MLKDHKFNAIKTTKSTYQERKCKYLSNENNHRLKTGENNGAHSKQHMFFPQKSFMTCILMQLSAIIYR